MLSSGFSSFIVLQKGTRSFLRRGVSPDGSRDILVGHAHRRCHTVKRRAERVPGIYDYIYIYEVYVFRDAVPSMTYFCAQTTHQVYQFQRIVYLLPKATVIVMIADVPTSPSQLLAPPLDHVYICMHMYIYLTTVCCTHIAYAVAGQATKTIGNSADTAGKIPSTILHDTHNIARSIVFNT